MVTDCAAQGAARSILVHDTSSPAADRRPDHASDVTALAARLQSLPEFLSSGFSLEFKTDALFVFRGPVLRGFWQERRGVLVWRSNGDGNIAFTASSVEAAARQTMLMVLQFLIARRR